VLYVRCWNFLEYSVLFLSDISRYVRCWVFCPLLKWYWKVPVCSAGVALHARDPAYTRFCTFWCHHSSAASLQQLCLSAHQSCSNKAAQLSFVSKGQRPERAEKFSAFNQLFNRCICPSDSLQMSQFCCTVFLSYVHVQSSLLPRYYWRCTPYAPLNSCNAHVCLNPPPPSLFLYTHTSHRHMSLKHTHTHMHTHTQRHADKHSLNLMRFVRYVAGAPHRNTRFTLSCFWAPLSFRDPPTSKRWPPVKLIPAYADRKTGVVLPLPPPTSRTTCTKSVYFLVLDLVGGGQDWALRRWLGPHQTHRLKPWGADPEKLNVCLHPWKSLQFEESCAPFDSMHDILWQCAPWT